MIKIEQKKARLNELKYIVRLRNSLPETTGTSFDITWMLKKHIFISRLIFFKIKKMTKLTVYYFS